jgi:hypothetical protein
MRNEEMKRMESQRRRDENRAIGRCINGGPNSWVPHGLVVRGGKCQRCCDVHKGLIPEAKRRVA